MSAAVEIDHLWEGYRPKTALGFRRLRQVHWALHDVSFDVAAGEIVGVLGGNGSGKTTLLQTVSGVLRPSKGEIRTVGRVTSLVDATGFHPELTGHENVHVAAQLLGVNRAELDDVIEEVAEFSELSEQVWNTPMRTYSAGMWLRLGLSLVLHIRPSVVLLDEVLAVGDERFQTQAWARVRQLCEGGCAVLVVTHRLEQVGVYCDRAVVLDHGELVFEGAAREAVDSYLARGGGDGEEPRWLNFGQHQVRRRRRRR